MERSRPCSEQRPPSPETLGDATVLVHRIPAGKDATLALTRVPPRPEGGHQTPVLLVHGNFSNRGFWISPKGFGLAPFLADRGYDAWILELRGHGLSPKGKAFAGYTAEDHIREDLPAAVEFVFQSTGMPAFLVGHSAGGIFVASALSSGALDSLKVLGAALFGAQISGGERFLKVPPLAWLSSMLLRLLGRLPSKRFGLGPEDEPAGEMLEFIRWKERGGNWVDSSGKSYWEGLSRVSVPVIALAGARDRNDPPEGCQEILEAFGSPDREFVLLAQSRGFLKDYDHIGMIVSREAAQEVWPLLVRWMDSRRARA